MRFEDDDIIWASRSSADKETFDNSAEMFLKSSEATRLPDLRQVGVRLDSGDLVWYGGDSPKEALTKAAQRYPQARSVSSLYAGTTGQVLQLNRDQTDVIRLVVRVGEETINLWQNQKRDERISKQKDEWMRRGSAVRRFKVTLGTLTPIISPDPGYVFRSDAGEEEKFVVHQDDHLTSKSVKLPSPYPPNLQPIGFKLENGVEYLYRTSAGLRSEIATAQAAAKEHPESKAVARLFQGEAGSRLEIALAGPTPVFRTDLRIDGRDITLWSNRKPDVPVK